MRRARRLLVACVSGTFLVASLASQALAWTGSYDIWNTNNDIYQNKGCWCVVAAAKTWLNYIPSATSPFQSTIETYMQNHNKYDWSTLPTPKDVCNDGSVANDSRGLAWAMYHYGSSNQSIAFNDYRFSSGFIASWSIVNNIRATGDPVAVTAAQGAHELLAVGFNTTDDPATEPTWDNGLNGFFIFDPWNSAKFGAEGLWSTYKYGIPAGTYITQNNWTSTYFYPDTLESGQEGNYYQNYWVVVECKWASGAPTDNPTGSYGDVLYSGQNGFAMPGSSSSAATDKTVVRRTAPRISTAVAKPAGSIAEAIAQGLAANDLSDGGSLGVHLAGYTIGATDHVDSLVADIDPYTLAELRVGGVPTAIALVNEVSGGYTFGAIRALAPGQSLPSAASLTAGAKVAGLTGTTRLGWAWTDKGGDPFWPFAATVDPSSGHARYFAPSGEELSINMPGHRPTMP